MPTSTESYAIDFSLKNDTIDDVFLRFPNGNSVFLRGGEPAGESVTLVLASGTLYRYALENSSGSDSQKCTMELAINHWENMACKVSDILHAECSPYRCNCNRYTQVADGIKVALLEYDRMPDQTDPCHTARRTTGSDWNG